MKIAVTGGYGFIGSRLVQRLVDEGHELHILDDLSSPVTGAFEQDAVTTHHCDISSGDSLAAIRISGVDLLLHLAAQSSPFVAFDNPQLDVNLNVIGTLNMIDWCRQNEVPRIIFASSFTAYGDQTGCEALHEALYAQPKSVYGQSKLSAESLLRIYAEPHGIAWNALRMFNVYGPGQDLARRDQGMVSIFLGIILEQQHVGVMGSLDRFRDFVYIDDVINGWMCCINNSHDQNRNQVFNLGSGSRTTVRELLDALINATGRTCVTYSEDGCTPGDILGCYADISNITAALGYEPATSLATGLRTMSEWAATQ